MEKKLIVFMVALFLTAGVVRAEEMKADMAAGMDKVENVAESAQDAAMEAEEMAAEGMDAAVEVGNTICPLTGRTLNLDDEKDFTTLEVNGKAYNVCPEGKAKYMAAPEEFAAKFADFDAKMAEEAAKAVPVVPEAAK